MSGAVISPCGKYRYTLHRDWPIVNPRASFKPCLFIMLNPSVADASNDDPTIRRCIGFAKGWGCTSLAVVNLFALRATDPTELSKAQAAGEDFIGPENGRHINEMMQGHAGGIRVAAWGAHPIVDQSMYCAALLPLLAGNVQCLGTTKNGSPRHPLGVKADQPLKAWSRP